jgi:hypothetical protein
MDLQGKIEKFNVPEIFQLISGGKRTGTLGIHRDEQSVMVYFRDGQIIYAYSPNRRNRLGDRLIARGIIEQKTLELTLQLQIESGGRKRLGTILIEKQYAKRDQIELILKEQISETVYRLMAWDRGLFKFYDGKFPTDEDVTLALSTENLILEGARRADEMNRLKAKLPEFSIRLQLKSIAADQQIDLKLNAADWNTMALCDGLRSIGRIMSDSGIDPVDTLKGIIRLMAAGLIEPVNHSSEDVPPAELAGLEEQIDSLANLLTKFLEQG